MSLALASAPRPIMGILQAYVRDRTIMLSLRVASRRAPLLPRASQSPPGRVRTLPCGAEVEPRAIEPWGSLPRS